MTLNELTLEASLFETRCKEYRQTIDYLSVTVDTQRQLVTYQAQRVTQLEQFIEIKNTEIARLSIENCQLNTSVQAYQDYQKHLEAKIEERTEEFTTLIESNNTLINENESLLITAERHVQEINELKERNTEISKQLQDSKELLEKVEKEANICEFNTIARINTTLSSVLANKVGSKNFTIEDLLGITHINHKFSNNLLSTLEGINYCINLKILVLDSTNKASSSVTDLSPLVYLINLKSLTLRKFQFLSNLEPLGKMIWLEELELNCCSEIRNFEIIGNLVNLKKLMLPKCKISTLEHLSNLIDLRLLDISETLINDISIISKFELIEFLSLSKTHVKDLSPLGNLLYLHKLDISKVLTITDLSPIQRLQDRDYCLNPTGIVVSSYEYDNRPTFNQIWAEKLSELKLKNKIVIDSDIRLTSQDLLSHCSANLQSLSIDFARDLDFFPFPINNFLFNILVNLRKLKICNCNFFNDQIEFPISLNTLELDNVPIYNLNFLQKLSNLNTLSLTSIPNNFDLEPVKYCQSIVKVNLCHSMIKSIEPLITLVMLEELDLSYCVEVLNFSVISNFSTLKKIKLLGFDHILEDFSLMLTEINVITEEEDRTVLAGQKRRISNDLELKKMT
ncbi:hypothetical protein RCL1_001642 [Eukaryota sp. TZLM3-RCL]